MSTSDVWKGARILIVDDDYYVRTLLQGLFSERPVDVKVAENAATARECLEQEDFNLIIMDQRLPDGNGLDLLRERRQLQPQQLAILITGYADVQDALRAVREGLFDYLTKPFDNLEELESVVEKALELDHAYREINRLRQTLDNQSSQPVYIGQSRSTIALQKQISQLAVLDVTVLIEGDSGTGKELVARGLHAQSPRNRSGRFMEINCGAVSEELLESTLFGYEKGAFTGAMKMTRGYLEEADGGTLFLDEIADMSTKLQSSLLRVLQEHTFTRIGSTSLRSSDFRLVCATNKRLIDEVHAGRFREDLFYRINVVTLEPAPLRKRCKDIVPLTVHFLEHFNDKFSKRVGPLTPEALTVLEGFAWPGNVRQLQHTIERLVALHGEGPISATDLSGLVPDVDDEAEDSDDALLPYQKARQLFEQDYLKRLMEHARGNVSEAARLSGIPRQNLYVRMKRWGES